MWCAVQRTLKRSAGSGFFAPSKALLHMIGRGHCWSGSDHPTRDLHVCRRRKSTYCVPSQKSEKEVSLNRADRLKTRSRIPANNRPCYVMAWHISLEQIARNCCFWEVVDDYVGPDNPVRFIEAFVDGLDLKALGFVRVSAKETGRQASIPAISLSCTHTDTSTASGRAGGRRPSAIATSKSARSLRS